MRRPSRSSKAIGSPWVIPGICLSLIGIIWLVFGQTLSHPFINFDDPEYVYENPQINAGLTGHGLLWAFTHIPSPDWFPLTSISHMLDVQFYGLRAGGHHLTSVLIHTAVVILLFLVLRQMTGTLWRSAFVAAVFAIHPLRVESVAWIAERKDLLSGVFFVLTLGAYVRYVRKRTLRRYVLMSILFACGLMSKPIFVTVPFVLLLLDYWPLRQFEQRLAVRGLILEKIPLLILSLAVSATTITGQTGKVVSMEPLPFVWRVNNALVSYVIYIWQMIWPARLAIFYPHPQNHLALSEIAFAIALLIAMTALAFALRKQCPYLIVGWFWYLVMLAPVIGVVQVNLQGHADRYTYLAQIGLYFLVVWSIADLSVSWPYRRQILSVAAGIVIVALVCRAWTQTQYWGDSESLWTNAIAVTSDNDTAQADLADLLLRRGRVSESVLHSQEALRIRPNNADAHNTLGVALFQMGDLRDAVANWKHSLEIQPGNMNAQVNLAWALATSPDASLRDGSKAIELAQNVAQRTGHPNAMVLRTLAASYAETGQFAEAIDTAQQAFQLASAQGNSALMADLQLNIASYRRELPLRDPGVMTAAPTP